jgi:hypothetical protein
MALKIMLEYFCALLTKYYGKIMGGRELEWTELGDPQIVKKYDRKATMLCHPDKLGNAEDNPDKVYIANRCFAAITEAYNIFKVRNLLIIFL